MLNVVLPRSQSVTIRESGDPATAGPALQNIFTFLNAKNRKKTAHKFFTLLVVFALLFATVPLNLAAADSSPGGLDFGGIEDPNEPSSPSFPSQAGTGSISGFLWVDRDWDGLYDRGEVPLSGYPVSLYLADDLSKPGRPQPIAQTHTSLDGMYSFNDLESGTYVVGLTSAFIGGQEYLLPMSVTDDSKFGIDWGRGMSFSAPLTVADGGSVQNINAGMREPAIAVPMYGGLIDENIDLSEETDDGPGYTVTGGTVPPFGDPMHGGQAVLNPDWVLTFEVGADGKVYKINQSGTLSPPPNPARPKSGSSIFESIVIKNGVNVTLIIDEIDIVGTIVLESNAKVTLLLEGNNNIKGNVFVPSTAEITIDSASDPGTSDGSLTVIPIDVTLVCKSGIGGNNAAAGKITINGGTVTTTSSYGGAGIGSGRGNGGTIIINGGTVTAAGGSTYSTGIGGGYGGNGGTIIINGGTVTAAGSYKAAGIGGNYGGAGGTITIGGDALVNATGGGGAAGIGGAAGGNGGTITVSGDAVVTATGGIASFDSVGYGGAGIGGSQGGSGGTIEISGRAVVKATGNGGAAGIGGGDGGTITISDNTVVTATGSNGGAGIGGGIGGGNIGAGATLTIDNTATVIAYSTGNLPAIHADGDNIGTGWYVNAVFVSGTIPAGTNLLTVYLDGDEMDDIELQLPANYRGFAFSIPGYTDETYLILTKDGSRVVLRYEDDSADIFSVNTLGGYNDYLSEAGVSEDSGYLPVKLPTIWLVTEKYVETDGTPIKEGKWILPRGVADNYDRKIPNLYGYYTRGYSWDTFDSPYDYEPGTTVTETVNAGRTIYFVYEESPWLDIDLANGDTSLYGDVADNWTSYYEYNQGTKTLTIKKAAEDAGYPGYRIWQSEDHDVATIAVSTGVTTSIVIDNIEMIGTVTLNGNAKVTLLLEGDNNITGNVIVPSAAEITIDSASDPGSSDGSLTVVPNGVASNNMAGIGGNNVLSGTIAIIGGTVSSTGGGFEGAGIGGGGWGVGGDNGTIIIGGNAVVDATGGLRSAGIGSSYYGHRGTITIGDNAVVTATGGMYGAGIGGGDYGGSSGTITISGNAVVTATSVAYGAGIGGGNGGGSGTVTISGDAVVNAAGGYGAAGIGDGGTGIGGNVTIEGNAWVNATGGLCGAGIGGATDTITIRGDATVDAKGGGGAAGIGGNYGHGHDGDGGTITIIGNAVVTATGGSLYYDDSGAGIGTGGNWDGAVATLTIDSTATVIAYSAGDLPAIHADGDNIGTGWYVNAVFVSGTLPAGTPNLLTVYLDGEEMDDIELQLPANYRGFAFSIPGYTDETYLILTKDGSRAVLRYEDDSADIFSVNTLGGYNDYLSEAGVSEDSGYLPVKLPNIWLVTEKYVETDGTPIKEGKWILPRGAADNYDRKIPNLPGYYTRGYSWDTFASPYDYEPGTTVTETLSSDRTIYFVYEVSPWLDIDLANSDTSLYGDVADNWTSYYEYNQGTETLTIKKAAEDAGYSGYRIWQSDDHDVAAIVVNTGVETTIVIDNIAMTGTVTLNGNANVTLLLEGDNEIIGNVIVPSTAEITIDSATDLGTSNGSLTVTPNDTASDWMAGIGGDNASSGEITISGGTVTATGGVNASGIGSGFDESVIDGGFKGSVGAITIGGNAVVTATGGDYGAGIGSGHFGSGGTITISGDAVVNATGNTGGSGIGGGSRSEGGTIMISGNAVVAATGGEYAAGIGCGSGGDIGGTITISGDAVVDAKGGDYGAGIGGGYLSAGGTITISDGTVTATGGDYGAGIGGGHSGAGGTITISDGTVTVTGGDNASGIGGGRIGAAATITIDNTATVIAYSTGDLPAIHADNDNTGTGWYVNAVFVSGTLPAGTPTPLTVYLDGDEMDDIDLLLPADYSGFAFAIPGYTDEIYSILTEDISKAVLRYEDDSADIFSVKTLGGYNAYLSEAGVSEDSGYLPVTLTGIWTVTEKYVETDGTPIKEGEWTVFKGVADNYDRKIPSLSGYYIRGYSWDTFVSPYDYESGTTVKGTVNADRTIYFVYEASPWLDIDLANSDTSLYGDVADNWTSYYEYNQGTKTLTIKKAAEDAGYLGYRIWQSDGHDVTAINVNTGVTTQIVIDNITLTGTVTLNGNAKATLLLEGNNNITGNVIVPSTAEIMIDSASDPGSSDGSLKVIPNGAASNNRAGIGGSGGPTIVGPSGKITINGGTVAATGGGNGAGIGSGYNGTVGNITISGDAVVTATGGGNGSGIGGGWNGSGGNITIRGNAVVTTTGGIQGAGIGGGYRGTGGNITISNDAVVIVTGGIQGAGIGGGSDGTGGNITIRNDAVVTATGGDRSAGIGGGRNSTGGTIAINGGAKVNATGGEYGAGIGGGDGGAGGTITIDGDAVVTAIGGYHAGNDIGGAGIGGGSTGVSGTITIRGDAVVNATGGGFATGIGSSNGFGGTITISGNATVDATGGTSPMGGGAGIGTGFGGGGITITINDNAMVTATGGNSPYFGAAAGIGGGTRCMVNNNITISGNAVVDAKGGSGAYGGGAGIGGGFEGVGSTITISGGTVTATGGNDAAGIGAGALGSMSFPGAKITIDKTTTVTAYSTGDLPAIHDDNDNTGTGWYVNALFVSGTLPAGTPTQLTVYLDIEEMDDIELELPAGYRGFAFAIPEYTDETYFILKGDRSKAVLRYEDDSADIFSVNTLGGYNDYLSKASVSANSGYLPVKLADFWTVTEKYVETDGTPIKEGMRIVPRGIADNYDRKIPHLSGYYAKGYSWDTFSSPYDYEPGTTVKKTVNVDRTIYFVYEESPWLDIDLANSDTSLYGDVADNWTSYYEYNQGTKTLTIKKAAEDAGYPGYRILQSDDHDVAAIVVSTGVTTKIVTDRIAMTGAVTLNGNAKVTLLLEGDNEIIGNVIIPLTAEITIDSASDPGTSNGSLTVTPNDAASDNKAGIGGDTASSGKIMIDGGTVTATGGDHSAGIGGGSSGSGGTIMISGGMVTATGGDYSAGIGGGSSGSGGTITISGGTVNATGGDMSAGIGGGEGGGGGTITIGGGTVTATGGNNGVGIGGGAGGEAATMTIDKMATVIAYSTGNLPAIHAAGDNTGTGWYVNALFVSGILPAGTPTPLTVYLDGEEMDDIELVLPAGYRGFAFSIPGYTDETYFIFIEDGLKAVARYEDDSADIFSVNTLGGYNGYLSRAGVPTNSGYLPVTLAGIWVVTEKYVETDGTPIKEGEWTVSRGVADNYDRKIPSLAGYSTRGYSWDTFASPYVYETGTTVTETVNADRTIYFVYEASPWLDIDLANSDTSLYGDVADNWTSYYEYNQGTKILTIKKTAEDAAGYLGYRIWQSADHDVAAIVVNTGVTTTIVIDDITLTGTMTLNGNAKVTLLLEGDNNITGNVLVPSTAEITIDSASDPGSSDGSLTVTPNGAASDYKAGIGGDYLSSATAGKITINGGTVTATGGAGLGAAGIGGGFAGSGGTVTISGNAVVTATGGSGSGYSGAGIGGGGLGPGGNIAINGNAVVTATGGAGAAGIGGGYYGAAATVTIDSTATVMAYSSGDLPAIHAAGDNTGTGWYVNARFVSGILPAGTPTPLTVYLDSEEMDDIGLLLPANYRGFAFSIPGYTNEAYFILNGDGSKTVVRYQDDSADIFSVRTLGGYNSYLARDSVPANSGYLPVTLTNTLANIWMVTEKYVETDGTPIKEGKYIILRGAADNYDRKIPPLSGYYTKGYSWDTFASPYDYEPGTTVTETVNADTTIYFVYEASPWLDIDLANSDTSLYGTVANYWTSYYEYNQGTKTLTIKKAAEDAGYPRYRIWQSDDHDVAAIVVNTGVTTKIIIDNINLTGRVTLNGNVNVTLLLEGDNNITGNVIVPSTAEITIDSASDPGSSGDSLTVTPNGAASNNMSGIGGNNASAGKITINGGTVTATGGNNTAGIGGGRNGNGGIITICGNAVVEAKGGDGVLTGAGIGGGPNGTGGTIVIRGNAVVTAAGGYLGGAGIGGGYLGTGGTITISDNTVVNTTGGYQGAGIGGGSGGGNGGNITISGGTVAATGGNYAAGIGGGSTGNGGNITISGGTVAAVAGGSGGAGIGGGDSGDGGTITISGDAVVNATGGRYSVGYNSGAGIGGSNSGAAATITIDSTATVTAYSTGYRPAIYAAGDNTGTGYYVNAIFNSTFSNNVTLSVYANGTTTPEINNLTLPNGYRGFAYSTGAAPSRVDNIQAFYENASLIGNIVRVHDNDPEIYSIIALNGYNASNPSNLDEGWLPVKLQTFTVTYKANGGTGADFVDDTGIRTSGSYTTINFTDKFTAPAGATFTGWNTQADGKGAHYDENQTGILISGSIILYAEWGGRYIVTMDDDDSLVGYYHWLQEAVDVCGNNSTDGSFTITATTDDPDVTDETDIAVTIPDDRNITLTSDGNGPHTITQPNEARHLIVNGNLTLAGIILEGDKGNFSGSVKNGGAEVSGADSMLIMDDGAVIQNCYSGDGGGGVYVTAGGIFKMISGDILNNTASSDGGGVSIGASGSFVMEDGSISDNTAVNGNGGGVYVLCIDDTDFGTFEMKDGKISDNQALNGNGGGIYAQDYSCLIISEDASFSGNTASEEIDLELNALEYKDMFPTINSIFGQHYSSATANHPVNNLDINARVYIVTFDANGGEFAGSHTTVSVTVIPKPVTVVGDDIPDDPTRTDYVFHGWNTVKDGSGSWFYKDTELMGSLTVYGIWTQEIGDFSKVSGGTFSRAGDPLKFTMTFTIPNDLDGYSGLLIYDELPATLDYKNASARIISTPDIKLDVDEDKDNNTVSVYLSETDLNDNKGKVVELVINTTVNSSWMSGDIGNTAKLFVQIGSTEPDPETDTPLVDDTETVTSTDFKKTADAVAYSIGGPLDYLISFTVPDDIDDYDYITVADTYTRTLLEYADVVMTINGSAVTSPDVVDSSGVVTFNISTSTIEYILNAGDVVVLTVTFRVIGNAADPIKNEVELYFEERFSGSDGTDELYKSDFSKTSQAVAYTPGGTIDYLIAFSLLDNSAEMVIWDEYPPAVLAYTTSVLKIDGTTVPTTPGFPTPDMVTFTVDLSAYSFNVGDSVELLITFDMAADATGAVTNRAGVTYDGVSGGEAAESVESSLSSVQSPSGGAKITEPVAEPRLSVPEPGRPADPDRVTDIPPSLQLVVFLFPIAVAIFLFLWRRRREEE